MRTELTEDAPELPSWLAPAFPFRRRIARVDGMRIHFVDEGRGRPVLLFHGNPTWSFLWRHVIARLVPEGVRVIAPDLFGFGLSDKPRRPAAHSVAGHVDVMLALVRALELEDITFVCQDWGGPIGTGVASHDDKRVHGLVLANTAVLPSARPFRPKAFHKFSNVPIVSDVAFRGLGFPLQLLDRQQGDRRSIGRFEQRAYRWPFRHVADRAGPLGLARMIPTAEDHPSTAPIDRSGAWVESFRGPTALVWGVRDPILGRAIGRHERALPRAKVTRTEAGHFLQEEVPDVLAREILRIAKS